MYCLSEGVVNAQSEVDDHQSIVLRFDVNTGLPGAMVRAESLMTSRTAAATAIAIWYFRETHLGAWRTRCRRSTIVSN